jgi:intracellular multiplication protein IcmX
MKSVSKLSLIALMCCTTQTFANIAAGLNAAGGGLESYVKNLGGFLGYDVSKSPTEGNKTISQNLLNSSATAVAANYLYTTLLNTLLGATPVDSGYPKFFAAGSPYAGFNDFANAVFAGYSSPQGSSGGGGLSANPALDQMGKDKYQDNPITQAIMNILGTPDYSYCLNWAGDNWQNPPKQPGQAPTCDFLDQSQVMANVIGTIPDRNSFFSFAFNKPVLSQLNANSLLAPLGYSQTSGNEAPSTSSPTPANAPPPGLNAENQIQAAANFIRYASGSVVPVDLPKAQEYENAYQQVMNPPSGTTFAQQIQAKFNIVSYLAKLRVFAAQNSAGVSNLYYIMSKRIPQNQGSGAAKRSQAEMEFTMATWRLFKPDATPSQWPNQINTASAATVQKEIATLLAEINYQLYLTRQQEERILMTNSLILIQNAKLPIGNFGLAGEEAGQ